MARIMDNVEMVYCNCGNYVKEEDMIPVNNDESICPDCGDAYEAYADAAYDRWKDDLAEQEAIKQEELNGDRE